MHECLIFIVLWMHLFCTYSSTCMQNQESRGCIQVHALMCTDKEQYPMNDTRLSFHGSLNWCINLTWSLVSRIEGCPMVPLLDEYSDCNLHCQFFDLSTQYYGWVIHQYHFQFLFFLNQLTNEFRSPYSFRILCHRGVGEEGSPGIIPGLPVLLQRSGILCHRCWGVSSLGIIPGLLMSLWHTRILCHRGSGREVNYSWDNPGTAGVTPLLRHTGILCHRGAGQESSPGIIPGLPVLATLAL